MFIPPFDTNFWTFGGTLWVIAPLTLFVMYELEKKLGLRDGYRNSMYIGDSQGIIDYNQSIIDALSSPVTGIKSREDIINPYDFLNFDYYARTARGKALFNEHLEGLKNIQAQQQASFDEWYNSEEQQAIRQRDAGLNPNLNGIESSSTQSPDLSQVSPTEGMQTVGQDALSGLSVAASIGSMLSSGISACANLASLSSAIALNNANADAAKATAANIRANTDAQTLATVSEFEKIASADVASRLANATSEWVNSAANAGQAFDFAGWFNDPKNSEGLIGFAPSDNPIYKAAIPRIMQRHQELVGKSYDVYGKRLENQSNLARLLSDPYADENLILQVGLMTPLYEAYKQKELMMLDYETKYHALEVAKLEGVDKELYLQDLDADLRKRIAENKYYTDYFNNFDGDLNALADMVAKHSDAIDKSTTTNIKLNLEQIYNDRPNTAAGQQALSMILGNGHLSFLPYLTQLGDSGVRKFANRLFGRSGESNSEFGIDTFWNLTFGSRTPHADFGGYDGTNKFIPSGPMY